MKKEKISYGHQADSAMRTWIDISRAFTAIRHRENEYFESKGLTIHQFAVLEALYHVGPLSIGQLTGIILSTPGNVTVVIKNLRKKDYIRPVDHDTDRRKTVLELTEEGTALIKDIFPKHAENMSEYFSPLDDTERETLQKLMKKLTSANRK